ncbi:hypothetical protein QBC46DRAFT_270497, partial [Diplogelasinospora grovesii]
DHEAGSPGRKACIAHRGADRLELSFGAVPVVIFDVKPNWALFFIVIVASGDDMKRISVGWVVL